MFETIGNYLKAVLISGDNVQSQTSNTNICNSEKLNNDKNYLNSLIELKTSEIGEYYPIIAYKGRNRVTIKPSLLNGFNEVFQTTFALSDEIVYYVLLMKMFASNKIYWMVRYAFGRGEDEVVLIPVIFDNLIETIAAVSLPHRSFNNNEHLDVYLFEAKKKKIIEISAEINEWLKTC